MCKQLDDAIFHTFHKILSWPDGEKSFSVNIEHTYQWATCGGRIIIIKANMVWMQLILFHWTFNGIVRTNQRVMSKRKGVMEKDLIHSVPYCIETEEWNVLNDFYLSLIACYCEACVTCVCSIFRPFYWFISCCCECRSCHLLIATSVQRMHQVNGTDHLHIPRCVPFIRSSAHLDRLNSKTRMRHHMVNRLHRIHT